MMIMMMVMMIMIMVMMIMIMRTMICLMFTTRNGESKIIKHTNKTLTAQVFSPKGASNNWFDQVKMPRLQNTSLICF